MNFAVLSMMVVIGRVYNNKFRVSAKHVAVRPRTSSQNAYPISGVPGSRKEGPTLKTIRSLRSKGNNAQAIASVTIRMLVPTATVSGTEVSDGHN